QPQRRAGRRCRNVTLSGAPPASPRRRRHRQNRHPSLARPLTGSAAGNYSLTSVGTTTADITPLGITGNFTADSGRNSGGQVAMVTKSGSNELHGSGFWLYRTRGGTAKKDNQLMRNNNGNQDTNDTHRNGRKFTH
ncbi:MAG: hypothetical protein HC782_04670, partial [Gammaproteobacteria bacterium]|nr:hypothetical protein [Gammaproteobacteria bacterium]